MPRSRKKRARARAKRAKTGEAELQGIREYGVPLVFCCSAVMGNSRITQRTQRNKYSFYSSFQINLESATRVCCGGVLPFAFAPIQLPLAPWLISFFLGNTSVSADRTDSDF